MTAVEFENRIVNWARSQVDIKALVQIGSRVQAKGYADEWSDWDFHLISNRPQKYRNKAWVREIAPPWSAHVERSPWGSIKVSAVFEDGLEADFVLLKAWQMALVYRGMKYPKWARWMPARLRQGVLETRVILLNSGYKVLVGGPEWEKRLAAMKVKWETRKMSAEELCGHVSAFWQKSVWVAKKIARPELRSAMCWLHKLSMDHVYGLLEEEALLAGRSARPWALKAEQWLDARRLAQTDVVTSLDQKVLARALLAQIDLFEEVSRSVATSRGFELPDHSAVAAWLRAELAKIIAKP